MERLSGTFSPTSLQMRKLWRRRWISKWWISKVLRTKKKSNVRGRSQKPERTEAGRCWVPSNKKLPLIAFYWKRIRWSNWVITLFKAPSDLISTTWSSWSASNRSSPLKRTTPNLKEIHQLQAARPPSNDCISQAIMADLLRLFMNSRTLTYLFGARFS